MWNDIAAVETIYKIATWSSVILAFLAGLAGVTAVLADNRKDKLEQEFKNTPPAFEVSLKTADEDGKFYIVIQPKNLIPFEFHYLVVTRNDSLITGIPLEWSKLYPKEQGRPSIQLVDIDLSKVRENYAELRFNFRSLFAAELSRKDLSGRIIKRYQLSEDKKSWLPLNN